ncbi:carboxypeptidase regulatory-like domain-containing protein [Dyadobacter sp. CY312]|uniref:carboxypeptidase regulatory-like domain-containing protein n=1 Tax=Dyadobacter sp. CY312 TaxID=2907303 RepID=UPI001F1FC835|nr:carboxypeptidase regulatory-like domain-containing protein [Dyadobacter sp. CY312]MCE7042537.1 carboxypeptidase regulatory-like domain-containing protein [Dyadobacter sp. CY312]
MKRLIFYILFLFGCLEGKAQNTSIRLTLNVLPPYSTSLTDYRPSPSGPGKMIVTVQNLGQQQQRIYIRAEVRGEDNGVRIYTSPDYVPATPIVLNPLETRQLFPDEIMDIYDPNRLVYIGTDQRQIKNSDRVPEGMYSICVRAYDHTPGRTNVPVSMANPAGCTTIFMRNTEPPILIQPFQDAEVKAFQPQNVIFSWTQPAGSDLSTRYRLRIVEMFEGDGRRIDPNVIYEASGSPIFDQEIVGSVYVYGPSDHALVLGRRYAWAVSAVDPSSKTAFRNNGRSEVRAFTYKPFLPGQIATVPLLKKEEKPKKGGRIALSDVRFTRDTQIRDLVINKFKGKLVWAFRKSEAGFVPTPPPAAVKEPDFPSESGAGIGNVNFKAFELASAVQARASNVVSKAAGKENGTQNNSANNSSNAVYALGGGATTMRTVSITLASRAKTDIVNMLTQRQRQQEKILSLADEKRYPLSQTKISVYLRKKSKSGKPAQAAPMIFWTDGKKVQDEILLGQTNTNSAGEFELNYMDHIPDGYDVYLKIENRYFEFADYDIPLVAGQDGTYDFGELVGLAKTFRLRVKVTNEEGSELELPKVRLERTAGFYNGASTNQNLLHEVMKDSITGQPAEVVAMGKSGSFWPRLFYSQGFADSYSVVIEGEGINKTVHNLNLIDLSNVGPNLSESDQVVFLEKSFVANVSLPVVEGRVLTKNGEVPVAGAVVTIRKKGSRTGESTRLSNGMIGVTYNLNDRSAVTDSLGKFKVENIPLNPEAVEVMVNFKGKQTIHDKDLYLSQRGVRENIDPLFINAELITVVGKVVDVNGEPLADASLNWKSGGKAFYSEGDGSFTGSQTEGKHTLIARKPGFRDTEYVVELKAESKQKGSAVSNTSATSVNAAVGKWTQSTSTAQLNFNGTGIYAGQKITPKKPETPAPPKPGAQNQFRNIASTSASATLTTAAQNYFDVFSDGMASSSISSGHVIVMSKFFVKALVKDAATGKPIAGANASAEGGEKISVTNASGVAIVEDVAGGNAAIVVSGPEGSFYETRKAEVILEASKDTLSVEVSLKAGSKATGLVKQGNSPVADAVVAVEGMEHIYAKTDQQGKYSLSGIPVGEYTLIASKEGLLAGEKSQQFKANEAYPIDFTLTDPGFNASKLLGFKLVLHRSKQGPGANEFIISGELKDLPDNPIFKKAGNAGQTLRFTDKTIIKEGNSIYPKGGELVTDVSEIKLKVFDYLVIKLKNQGGLRVRPTSPNNRTEGEIAGEAEIDWGATFSAISGITLPSIPVKIKTGNADNIIAPITSAGTASLTSLGITGPAEGWSLYGIKVIPDLPGCTIDKEGLNLKGKVKIDNVPILSNQELKLERFVISKRGEIKDVSVNLNPQPTLTLITWKLKLSGVSINQYGLKLNGEMEMPIPSSDVAKIAVKELGINGEQLTGGTFLLPSTGVDIFGQVKFQTTAGKDFTIQKISGSTHYRFIGAGTINLPKWINQRIVLDHFSVATNGDFSVVAETDVEVDFAGMAKLGITKFGFASNVSQITVGGKFRLNIPMFGIGADGTLYFRKGQAPRIDELGINFNLASAIALEAKLKLNDTEFRGKGAMKLAGIPGVGLEFWYEKKNRLQTINGGSQGNSGIRVGAKFDAKVVIPIGLVKLDGLTGGFDFDFAENIYSINAGGRITIAPDPYGVVALDPIAIKITSAPGGPIFEGNAGVKVLDAWTLGSATMKLDFNKKQFFIDGEFGAGFSLMKGIDVESKSGVHLELYTGTGSNYWFVAGYSKTRILGIFDTGVTIAAGWNVPKSTHTSLSGIPDYALTNGRLYGGYFGTHSSIDLGPYTARLGPASASAWYKNSGMCEVYANFKSNSYGLKIASDWRAGARVSISPFGDIASADVRFAGGLEGYYGSNRWGIEGNLSGTIRGHIGCDGGCNFFAFAWPIPVPCGFKICASGAARVAYSSTNGLSLSLKLSE